MSLFTNTWNKFTGLWDKGQSTPPFVPASSSGAKISAPAQVTRVPIPSVKPSFTPAGIATSSPTYAVPASSGFSFSNALSFLDKAAETASKGVQSFFQAKSMFNQAQTAQELEKIKLEAVTASAKQAPLPARVMLPSFADWINNPREAASMVTPAALSGSGIIQSGTSALVWIVGGAAAIMLIARK